MKTLILKMSVATILTLSCLGPANLFCQTPQSAVAEFPPGPTMKETEAWIKRELRAMGSDHVITKYKDTTWGDRYSIESAVISDCNLVIRQGSQHESFMADGNVDLTTPRISTSTIPLKDVDVAKLDVREIPVGGATMNKPSYRIVVVALPDRGDAFMSESDASGGGKTRKSIKAIGVRVRDQSLANQAVPFLRRAAILCGAPFQSGPLSAAELEKVSGKYNEREKSTNYLELRADSTFVMKHDAESVSGTYKIEGDVITLVTPASKDPLKGHIIGNSITNDKGNIGWEKPVERASAQSQTSKPASKMNNEDVIQLVTAGLSEQVIVTSIRQASSRDFDLTPTGLIALKKANVPDAVIVVMQEKGAAEPTPTANDKTAPKYDPTLGRPTAAAASQGPCSGVESMGIFKNTAIDAAIGGGVVEWLAKIRNNTNVTRIIVFGWIDMYGQQKQAQVQIRGGDIASVRIDLTQARMIAPVRDLRIVSCQ